MIDRPQRAKQYGDLTFCLRRPGRGGLGRIQQRIAGAITDPMGGINAALVSLDMRGIEMEAVLSEYLRSIERKGGTPTIVGHVDATGAVPGTGTIDGWRFNALDPGGPGRYWDFEDVDGAAFADVGEEALAFHATFREVDDRFRAQDRVDAG